MGYHLSTSSENIRNGLKIPLARAGGEDGAYGEPQHPALSLRPLLRGVPQPVHGRQQSHHRRSGTAPLL